MIPAIEVQALTKSYGASVAVDHLTFSVRAGGATALLGGNGAGKTTTLSMLLGLLTPTSGSISVLGVDMAKNRWLALPRMNFSSPYVDLPLRLTVLENLRIYARLYGVTDRKARIAELAQDLELTQLMNRSTGSLSAGQRTRVALAKALINRPELLLLDEPTASLDPDTADWVRGYLADYQKQRGATILLASHNMREVERLADDVLMLRKGKLVDRGSPSDLISRYGREDLEQVFLDIARGGGVGTDAAAGAGAAA